MKNGLAILSLHDVSPAHHERIARILEEIELWGLPSPALLVVPNHHGRWPVDRFDEFLRVVRAAQQCGSELILHGFEHIVPEDMRDSLGSLGRVKAKLLTDGEGEFQSLGIETAILRLRQGRAIIERCFGTTPNGFVAPAWLEHRQTEAALAFEGFEFHEDHLFVRQVSSTKRHFAPAITFSARSAVRTRASVIFARAMRRFARTRWNLRLALHPRDFDSIALREAIRRFAEEASWSHRWVSYDQFFENVGQGE